MGEIVSVIFWALVIVVAIVVGFVAVTWVRRWAATPDQLPTAGFTLGDLRDLHKSGQMSDEEFEKAKAKIVDAARAAAARQAQQTEARPGPKGRPPGTLPPV